MRGFVSGMATLGDRAMFVVESSSVGTLWVTDGTPLGTRPVTNGTDLDLEWLGNNWVDQADSFTASGGYVYFSAASASEPADDDLWRSDGTPEGTHLVKDLPAATTAPYGAPRDLVDLNGTLFFAATA